MLKIKCHIENKMSYYMDCTQCIEPLKKAFGFTCKETNVCRLFKVYFCWWAC